MTAKQPLKGQNIQVVLPHCCLPFTNVIEKGKTERFWKTPHEKGRAVSLFFFFYQFTVEPASRNQRVVGGKGLKRKRSKKEVVKPPRKKRKGTGVWNINFGRPKKSMVCIFFSPLFLFIVSFRQRTEEAHGGA